MRMILSIASLLLAAPWQAAPAADAKGNYAVWGVGHASCNQFANAYEKNTVQDFKHFLAGYLTAFNTITEGVYQATGQNTVADNLKALHAHCDTHRMDSFELAIQTVLEQSAKAQATRKNDQPQRWGRPLPPPDTGS